MEKFLNLNCLHYISFKDLPYCSIICTPKSLSGTNTILNIILNPERQKIPQVNNKRYKINSHLIQFPFLASFKCCSSLNIELKILKYNKNISTIMATIKALN